MYLQVFRPLYHVGKIIWIDKHVIAAPLPQDTNCNDITPNTEDNCDTNSQAEKISDMSENCQSSGSVSKKTINRFKPVLLKEEDLEWQRIHIGHRLIADHWPHEYQKTLKLFLDSHVS